MLPGTRFAVCHTHLGTKGVTMNVALKEEGCPAAGMNEAGIRVLLVGDGQRAHWARELLCGSGVVLSHGGVACRARPEVWQLDLDVILLLLGPRVDGALEALAGWR